MIALRRPGAFSRRVSRVRRLMNRGPQFSDRYSMGDLICRGSQGAVYRAYDKTDSDFNKKSLAVKVVDRRDLTQNQEKQILREVAIMRNLAGLEHTNKIVDFFQSPKKFYIVQELAHGGDVFDWVVQNGCYDEHEAREFAIKLLQTIQEYHSRGYVHRDLKPENLLLADKTNTSVLIADWGYADRFDPENPPTQKCGTPGFTPPEIIAGQAYGQAVDLWSTGCILYMILAGRPAFYGKDNDELFHKISTGRFRFHDGQWRGISQEAKDCIRGLLTVDPEARWTPEQALASDWLSGRTTRSSSTRSLPQ